VEGDSEYASIPLFAQKLSIDFDDLGICVIQARGDSIPQLIKIASHYGIPSVGITDKDNGRKAPTLPNHFQTSLLDFEEEIVIPLIDSNKEAILRNIISFDPKGDQREMETKALNKRAFEKYKIITREYTENLKLADIPSNDIINLKSYYLTWFSINKSYPLGKLIGEAFSVNEIPVIYQTIISKAHGLVQNV
jgi:putative ATP-dependent endonuclease of OLD family